MKLRKIAAMLLSFALVSTSAVTYVSAAEAKNEDPGVTLSAEVTDTDEYGAIVTVTIKGAKFAPVVKSGRQVSSVLGAASVSFNIAFNDLLNTSTIGPTYATAYPNQVKPTVSPYKGNGVAYVWQTTDPESYVTGEATFEFAVDDADGVINTVEEYNANLKFTDVFINVLEYVDGALTYNTAVGFNEDCKFDVPVTVPTSGVEPVDPVVESVVIAPETATVKGGESVTFTATVEGTHGNDAEGNVVALDKSVTWSTTAGTIVDGVFTAPDATNEAQTITVTATSVADATKTATATVTVEAVAVIPVQPPVVTIADAVKTNDAWLKANSKAGAMFWIVTVKGSSEDSEIDSVNFTLTDTDADTDNTRSQDVAVNIAGEGSMVFGAYTTFATEERLAHAMELAVTAGETTATSRAVYSDLAE